VFGPASQHCSFFPLLLFDTEPAKIKRSWDFCAIIIFRAGGSFNENSNIEPANKGLMAEPQSFALGGSLF
jgi:hypothetical protein